MSDKRTPTTNSDQPIVYQIRIKGHLGDPWAGRFDGLTIALEDNGETLLTGPIRDQAALHGLLRKMRDLGMPLLSINQIQSGSVNTADMDE